VDVWFPEKILRGRLMRQRAAIAFAAVLILAGLPVVFAQTPDCTVQRCVSLPVIAQQVVPTNTPTAMPSGLIVNGNFELGRNVGWIEASDFPYVLVTTEFPPTVNAHSGVWGVWLGGDYDGSTAIIQQVTITADKPYLSYWYWIASADICYEDVGGVALLNNDGIVTDDEVVDAYLLCDETSTGGWVQRWIGLHAFVGQTRQLFILAGTDSTLNSNLFVDDVSFEEDEASEASAPIAGSDRDASASRSGEVKPADSLMKEPSRKIDALSRVQEMLGHLP
jgi:hypothetical protein